MTQADRSNQFERGCPNNTGQAVRAHAGAGRALVVTVLAIVMVLVVTVGWGWATRKPGLASQSNRANSGQGWYLVERGSFALTVTAAGELETKHKVEIKSRVEGRTTIVELIDEGASVTAGDLLVKLADDQIKEKLEQASLDVEKAQSEMVGAELDLEIKASQTKSALDAAQVAWNLSKLDLAKWENGTDPQQQRELELGLERAKRTLKRAKRDLGLSKQLYEEKFISLSELEDDEIAVIESQNALESAQLAIEVYRNYTQPKEYRKALTDVAQASDNLARTAQQNKSELAQARAQLQSMTRTLKIRQDKHARLIQELAYTTILAPQDGQVVYASSVGSRRRRSDPIVLGKEVKLNDTILVLPDLHQMVAAVRVHEAMLQQVQIGQDVTITIDAQPAMPMQGKVTQIAVTAVDGGWLNPQLREYIVRVDLPPGNEDHTLKPAMRCSGQILVGQVEDALAVPIQAVTTIGQQRYCFVRTSANYVRRQPVQIGRTNEALVEIIEGLHEGDQVLLREPKPGELVGG